LLPGGDLPAGTDDQVRAIHSAYAGLPRAYVAALAQRHGSRAKEILQQCASLADLGEHFGADLYAREIDHFIDREWARTADDILWRRTKAGLHTTGAQQARLGEYITGRAATL
jgi:glycerol-3-phosphate dehydrogenase